MLVKSIERLGMENPQLLRELKGRLTPKNTVIAFLISFIGQSLVYFYFTNLLPYAEGLNRYCTAKPPEGFSYYNNGINNYCIKDLNGNWQILSRLWWLDIFVTLSVIGIFALLVVGSYQLISDIANEERRGTLNFIRLSPRSAKTIFIGKILGVPSLLYFVALLAIPFHFWAGISAGIPAGGILIFYGLLILACAFFYTASLVFTLGINILGGFQAWLGSGAILLFLFYASTIAISNYGYSHTTFDWLLLFYPGYYLFYLVQATHLPPATVGYYVISESSQLLWYGLPLWRSWFTAMVFLAANYCLWTYWMTLALKRRFHNPLATLTSKAKSYILTLCFTVTLLGFVHQKPEDYNVFAGFALAAVIIMVFMAVLVVALTRSRQDVQDWARYRHDQRNRVRVLKEFLLGEKSPSTGAIAVNLAIVILFFVPAILASNLGDYKYPALHGFLLTMNMALVYAALSQRAILMKNGKRALIATGAVIFVGIFPLFCLAILGINPTTYPLFWAFTPVPMVATEYITGSVLGWALFGQCLGLTLLGLQIDRQINQLGSSATKALSADKYPSIKISGAK